MAGIGYYGRDFEHRQLLGRHWLLWPETLNIGNFGPTSATMAGIKLTMGFK
jgi:hypothetical protein